MSRWQYEDHKISILHCRQNWNTWKCCQDNLSEWHFDFRKTSNQQLCGIIGRLMMLLYPYKTSFNNINCTSSYLSMYITTTLYVMANETDAIIKSIAVLSFSCRLMRTCKMFPWKYDCYCFICIRRPTVLETKHLLK